MKKYCTKCGKPFESIGREVICPACKAAAAEETKRAAVERAKRASWSGESVPVRISGRASTVIRRYGVVNGLPFAAALDALLKGSEFFQSSGKAWGEVEPYRSHRRDKATSTPQDAINKPQDAINKPQDEQEVKQASKPQEVPQDVAQAAKTTSKKVASKATSKATSKTTSTSKAAGKGGKA